MGLGGISIWQLLIILAIVVMLFGTSRLRNIGSDLGSAIKGFRNSMSKDEGRERECREQHRLARRERHRQTPDLNRAASTCV